jgi:hypothetical protein
MDDDTSEIQITTHQSPLVRYTQKRTLNYGSSTLHQNLQTLSFHNRACPASSRAMSSIINTKYIITLLPEWGSSLHEQRGKRPSRGCPSPCPALGSRSRCASSLAGEDSAPHAHPLGSHCDPQGFCSCSSRSGRDLGRGSASRPLPEECGSCSCSCSCCALPSCARSSPGCAHLSSDCGRPSLGCARPLLDCGLSLAVIGCNNQLT